MSFGGCRRCRLLRSIWNIQVVSFFDMFIIEFMTEWKTFVHIQAQDAIRYGNIEWHWIDSKVEWLMFFNIYSHCVVNDVRSSFLYLCLVLSLPFFTIHSSDKFSIIREKYSANWEKIKEEEAVKNVQPSLKQIKINAPRERMKNINKSNSATHSAIVSFIFMFLVGAKVKRKSVATTIKSGGEEEETTRRKWRFQAIECCERKRFAC